jgi:hypothetical protein
MYVLSINETSLVHIQTYASQLDYFTAILHPRNEDYFASVKGAEQIY